MTTGAQDICAAVCSALGELPFLTVYSAPNRSGIVSFKHSRIPSEEVAALLDGRFDIAVRGGLHCAPLAHRALGTFPDGLVRASFSPFQGKREANALLSAMRKICSTSA